MKRVIEACDYAARMHVEQRRKGAAAEPYVNHVIDVAARAAQSPAADETLIIAALLHDIVEDTAGTESEISARFGVAVAKLVMEVTDDKSLPKDRRKALQVETVAKKSDHARRIKLADKASNLTALCDSPPDDWGSERIVNYVLWAEQVIEGCRGVDAVLEAGFAVAAARARDRFGLARVSVPE